MDNIVWVKKESKLNKFCFALIIASFSFVLGYILGYIS